MQLNIFFYSVFRSLAGRFTNWNFHLPCVYFFVGNEPPESLFMKELRRRGITPTSLLEESNRSTIEEEITEDGVDRLYSKRNAVATGSDKSLTNQREQSMALNSEGLEVDHIIPFDAFLFKASQYIHFLVCSS